MYALRNDDAAIVKSIRVCVCVRVRVRACVRLSLSVCSLCIYVCVYMCVYVHVSMCLCHVKSLYCLVIIMLFINAFLCVVSATDLMQSCFDPSCVLPLVYSIHKRIFCVVF